MDTLRLGPYLTGDTWPQDDFQFQDDDGRPIDLTGASLRMQVRDAPKGAILLDLSTTNSGLVITDAVNGEFIRPARLLNIKACDAFWDVEITLADGTVQTYPEAGTEGRLKLFQDITRTNTTPSPSCPS